MNRFKNKIFLLLIVAANAYGTQSSSGAEEINNSRRRLRELRSDADRPSNASASDRKAYTREFLLSLNPKKDTSDATGTSS